MNISGPDNKYSHWINSLPVAKNQAGSLTNNYGIVDKKTDSTDMDKILYNGDVVKSDIKNYSGKQLTEGEVFPSSERDYTEKDAIMYQYNKLFSIKLEDIINNNYQNIKLRDPSQPIPQDFIDSLKQNGIQDSSYDTFRTQFYLNGLSSSAPLEHSIDYIASGYAVARENIENNYSGEEKDNLIKQLESAYLDAAKTVADKTANELGGFLEENGASGEKQKIYDSIINAYNNKVDEYSTYIKENKDYANINGTDKEWLKKDDSYMSTQLRKATDKEQASPLENAKGSYYTLDEITKTQAMVDTIKGYQSGGSKGINSYMDEEQIGFKLGELALKGEIFYNHTDVSSSLKNAIKGSMDSYIDTITDKLNAELEKNRAGLAEPDKLSNLNKKDIFSVFNKMMDTYKATGNLMKSLLSGAEFGKNQHMDKIKNPQYSYLNRYGEKGATFWNNFFQNTVKYQNSTDIFGNIRPNNGYVDKESGIEALTDSWNKFVSSITDDINAKLNIKHFEVYG